MSITDRSGSLTPKHQRMLYEESGIDPGVAAERGYYTAHTRDDVPQCFKDYQRRPGLVIPSLTPSGERRYRLRPNNPRRGKDGRPRKYEQVGGASCNLDAANPRNLARLRDSSVDLWIVEGEKKADALISRGECAVSIPGVWNWQRGGAMLPDFDYIPLDGRDVRMCYDSDTWSNPNVALALARHISALLERGARVLTVILEDAPDGSKVGADDFLARGGTVDDLKALAAVLAPEEIARERLARDEEFRERLEDLERALQGADFSYRGGDTDFDVLSSLCEAAPRGKVVEDGVYVEKAWGTMQLEARIQRNALRKSLERLEARGYIRERVKPRERGKSGGFILSTTPRAKRDHYREGQRGRGESNDSVTKVLSPSLFLRAPRLRHSDPGYKGRRGTVKGTRKVRQSPAPEPRPAIRRLGKRRSHVLDALDAAGGVLDLRALAAALHHKRPRDLRRRTLPMLEDAGIITIEQAESGDVISLTPGWMERLEDARELGAEIIAERIAAKRMQERRTAYHGRNRPAPKSKTSPKSRDAVRASREKRTASLAAQRERAAAAAGAQEQRRAEAFVRDRLRELGRIRLALLQDIWRDEGGDAWSIPQAVEALGYRVEDLPEYDNRRFVFAPMEGVA